jgi:hypothetical protein
MIAASESERSSFTMEMDPAFAQAIIERFQAVYAGATLTSHEPHQINPTPALAP